MAGDGHEHDHAGHDHLGHAHGISADADRGKLTVALALLVGFMLVEVVVGLLVHSLALLSDAAHMLTDAGAIALSLVALHLAARPARGAMTFGFKRAEILSAQFNGATLLVLGLLIVYEGIDRLVAPPDVGGAAVLLVALAGVAVNLAATLTLARADRRSLNVEGSFRHLLTDLFAFVVTAVAGAVILWTASAAPTASPPSSSRPSCSTPPTGSSATPDASSWRPRPVAWTPTPSAGAWSPLPGCGRSTTCTSGR